MGLDTTHNCWHGAYSSFSRWRKTVADAAGYGNLDDYEGFGGKKRWPDVEDDILVVLLHHSDCDGEIYSKDCLPLAIRLERLIVLIKDEDWQETTQQFVDGLRLAAELGENVEFR
jgi:hypothetical protein